MGEYDAVMTVEMPTDAAMVTMSLAQGSLGNIRTTTLRAFSESEMIDMVGKLP